MNIRLDCSDWIVDDNYIISGDVKNGYIVYQIDYENDDDKGDIVYHNNDFESCLTWCYNS